MKYLSALIIALSIGCASPGSFRKPTSQLDGAIRFTEVTVRGTTVALSGAGTAIMQVPSETPVDINSSIRIELNKDAIQMLGGDAAPDQAQLSALSAQRTRLSETLTHLAEAVEARTRSLAALEGALKIPSAERQASPAFAAFSDADSKAGTMTNTFATLPIWEEKTFSEDEVEEAFNDKTWAKVGDLLRRELGKAEAEFQETIDRANRNAGTLTMEAFLKSGGDGEETPIHLEGYDHFDKKSVSLKNSSVMDGDDWKAFEQQYAQVVDIAKQAERVRTGEVSLDQAILKSGSESLKKMVDGIAEARLLFEKDWREYLSRLQKDITQLQQFSAAVLKKESQGELDYLKGQGEALSGSALRELPLADAKALAEEIKKLQQEWRRATPESMVGLITRTQGLKPKAENLIAALQQVNFEATIQTFGQMTKSLGQQPASMSQAAWAEIRGEIQKTPSLVEAQATFKALESLGNLAKEIPTLLKFSDVQPSRTNVRSPQVVDVPLAQAKDTAIELVRTPRVLNDRVSYIATLKSGPATIAETKASFSVREFGWHSVMAPSVIMSRQWRAISQQERDVKFSPAVAWLRKYYPRDTQSGAWNALSRFFQPGFGVHAAFLDHHATKDTEIGLGAAVSFGNDLFVAGVGANMMNNSKTYFYVGSNLIPILQKLGYAKDGGAGKKP